MPITHMSKLGLCRNVLHIFLNGNPLNGYTMDMIRNVLTGCFGRSQRSAAKISFRLARRVGDYKCRHILLPARSWIWTSLLIFLLVLPGQRKKWTVWYSYQSPLSEINSGRIGFDVCTCHKTNTQYFTNKGERTTTLILTDCC